MPQPPLFIVDIIGEVIQAVDTVIFPILGKHINYEYGSSLQIQTELQKLNGSVTLKSTKYPLMAVFQGFPESIATGGYMPVTFPAITIATLTTSTDSTKKRYDKIFRTTLYPIYQEFLRQLPRHRNVVGNCADIFGGKKVDYPGSLPVDKAMNEYVDAIEIQGLQITFKYVQNCKRIKTT